ncbi:patatin-like phospholipase family protein [Pontiella agarivorans]|uniref:Patatin-like phospholipase family protein n=1 Tax=Pontiella agarivorans TaxID=3038953 RepID=A0ABU5MTC9_9BACT|nr:patatin-like phospholipase family protein [Pontiella agarivorans]MDZ8117460.1 patatin-like phospholipase family protein [Pontiella agarivorans]
MKKIGLTLGGGGARGFAHLAVLEVFDELGVKPSYISGTSIGAIIGALYAAGNSAAGIHEMVSGIFGPPKKNGIKKILKPTENFKFIELFDPHLSLKPKGLIKGEKLLNFLYEKIGVSTFEELEIPLKTVATDFWRNEQVVFSSGELLPAIRASMAIPYVFTPICMDDRVLVDGGLVNNVPLDLLSSQCDIRIAVDVMGESSKPKTKVPNPIEAVFHTYEVMMSTIADEKLAANPVDIFLRIPLVDAELLDFHKTELIYNQGLAVKGEFKRQLTKLIENNHPIFNWLRRR